MDLNELAAQKAKEVLRTKGIQIKCPNCGTSFTARSMTAVCPSCHKSFTVQFNVH
jgi:Zn finger protein HypA/HybF involved in hydrogenase expression